MATLILTTSGVVLKVMAAAGVGSLTALCISEQTVRELNFLNGNIISPAFAFTSLVLHLTADLVQSSWIMFVFAAVTIVTSQIVGFGFGWMCCGDKWTDELAESSEEDTTVPQRTRRGRLAFRWISSALLMPSPRDYQPIYACVLGTQNTGNFPIALLTSLVASGLRWYDATALARSLSLIFVYTAIWNLSLWSISLWALRRGKRLREQRAVALLEQAGSSDPTFAVEMSQEAERHEDSSKDLTHSTLADDPIVPHDWLQLNEKCSTLLVSGSPVSRCEEAHPENEINSSCDVAAAPPTTERPAYVQVAQRVSRWNLPIWASVVGMALALTPGASYLTTWLPVAVAIGGLSIVGEACVPLSLLTLGANLTVGGTDILKKVDPRFLVAGTVAKTMVQPAMNVAIFVALLQVGVVPDDNVLRITILTELISPSAVMSATLCKLEDYMAEHATSLLLVQYCVATFTTTAWLSLFLSFMPS